MVGSLPQEQFLLRQRKLELRFDGESWLCCRILRAVSVAIRLRDGVGYHSLLQGLELSCWSGECVVEWVEGVVGVGLMG